MEIVNIILISVFVIVCLLIVLMVLVQNQESGMGGVFGGGNSAVFGARSGSVLTRTTYVFVGLFFATTFVLALLNKVPSVGSLDAAAAQVQETEGTSSWVYEDDTPAVVPSDAPPPAVAE
ncbi:MAG: hypothetical protein Ta2A_17540 [Treponemataceae bacterium]|nr:MAG: hypothetical protein Ta2A_17540 [Treponemataceae bacterium]